MLLERGSRGVLVLRPGAVMAELRSDGILELRLLAGADRRRHTTVSAGKSRRSVEYLEMEVVDDSEGVLPAIEPSPGKRWSPIGVQFTETPEHEVLWPDKPKKIGRVNVGDRRHANLYLPPEAFKQVWEGEVFKVRLSWTREEHWTGLDVEEIVLVMREPPDPTTPQQSDMAIRVSPNAVFAACILIAFLAVLAVFHH